MSMIDPLRRNLLAALAGTAGAAVTHGTSVAGQGGSLDTAAWEMNPAPGEIISLKSFGADGSGRADDTAAFQKAVDHLARGDGGTIIMPPGIFSTGTVYFPYEKAISVEGAGASVSKWKMLSPTHPLARVPRTTANQRNYGCRFRNFGIVAHSHCDPSNTHHIAFDAIGFNNVVFENIRYFDDYSGSVGILFYTASSPLLTYNQTFKNLYSLGNRGPGYMLKTGFGQDPEESPDTKSYLKNTNLIYIDGFWIYSNTDMYCAFDMSCCTQYTIARGLIESIHGHGIILGQGGLIQESWLEDIAGDPLHFQNGKGSVTSSSNKIDTIYLSGFDRNLIIPNDCTANILSNISGGQFKVTRQDSFGGNILSNNSALGGKPDITQTFGSKLDQPVTEVPGTGVMASRADGLWHFNYRFKPIAAGNFGFKIDAPPGYAIKRLHVGCHDQANGVPYIVSVTSAGSFMATCPNANTTDMFIQLAYE